MIWCAPIDGSHLVCQQVEWLKVLVAKVPLRLVFESALELMSCTQVGTFQVDTFANLLRVLAVAHAGQNDT
jgi:Domain of unknown function (DUF3479)